MKKFEKFEKMHFEDTPLLLANAWNVQSALQYEKLGFKAIGTSSAAIAADLGYEDGENMLFDDYFFLISRIASAVKIPLTVDLEAGYGNTAENIIANIVKLHQIGVVGINIEDSVVINSERSMTDADDFTLKLKNIVRGLNAADISVFINVRCDAFLLNIVNAAEEAKLRVKKYEETGIHGFFLPCITDENDIKDIAAYTPLPLNVMCMPNLPNFVRLKELGVKRISMGNFVHSYLSKQMEEVMNNVIEKNSFSPIF